MGKMVRHMSGSIPAHGYFMIDESQLPIRDCSCNVCLKASRNRSKSRSRTQGSTNFRSVPQRNDSTVTNHYFNSPGDGGDHGHVKEKKNPDGTVSYPFVRDVEGNEYDAD